MFGLFKKEKIDYEKLAREVVRIDREELFKAMATDLLDRSQFIVDADTLMAVNVPVGYNQYGAHQTKTLLEATVHQMLPRLADDLYELKKASMLRKYNSKTLGKIVDENIKASIDSKVKAIFDKHSGSSVIFQ